MNIGKPKEVVEVTPSELDAPPAQRPIEAPQKAPATPELVPA